MYAERIEATLRSAVARATASPCPPGMRGALRAAVLPGGVRLRPHLVLAVATACEDDAPALADAAAAAIELLHCASLVHDDLPCFDDAALRRGRPTVHVTFGQPRAVLSGDALIVEAFRTLALAPGPAERKVQLTAALAEGAGSPFGIAAGQAWEEEPSVDVGAYHRAKTAALFVAAARMGALAAGGDADAWAAVGERLGLAYQVADDLADHLATAAELGKPVGQDAAHDRPNLARRLGVDGALAHLESLACAARAAVPDVPRRGMVTKLIDTAVARLLPGALAEPLPRAAVG